MDKLRTISAIICILSVAVILGITVGTMMIQAMHGGPVLYGIGALVLGSACYYITVLDKIKQRKIIDDIIKKDWEDGLYEQNNN